MPRFRQPPARPGLAEVCADRLGAEPLARAVADHCHMPDPEGASRGAVLAVPLVISALQRSLRDVEHSDRVTELLGSLDPDAFDPDAFDRDAFDRDAFDRDAFDPDGPADPVATASEGHLGSIGGSLVEILLDGAAGRQALEEVAGGIDGTPATARCLYQVGAWAVATEAVRRAGDPVDRSTLAAALDVDLRRPRRPPAPQIESATIVNEVATTAELDSILAERNRRLRRSARRRWVLLGAALVLALAAAGAGAGGWWWLDRRDDGGGGDVLRSAQSGSAAPRQVSEAREAGGSSGESGGSLIVLDLTDPLGFSGAEATAELSLDPAAGRVCYSIASEGIDAPHSGSLREGPAGFDGPAVVDLGAVPREASGCVAATAEAVEAVLADPGGHYLELVDPGGELVLRAQLVADDG